MFHASPKSSSGLNALVLQRQVMQGKNILKNDYVMRWIFFEKRQHHFMVWEQIFNSLLFQMSRKRWVVWINVEIF